MKSSDVQAAIVRDLIAQGIQNAIGLNDDLAFMAANAAYENVRQYRANEKLYFPGQDPFRVEKILADFDGHNHDAVCRKHRISRRSLDRYLQSR